MWMPLKETELREWAEKAREARSHVALLAQDVPIRLAHELSQWLESGGGDLERARGLLLVLRNLCSSGPTTADSLLDTQALRSTRGTTHILTATGGPLGQEEQRLSTLTTATQFLANLATASQAAAQAVWEEFYPLGFQEISGVSSWEVLGPLCTSILSCVRWLPRSSSELCSKEGVAVVCSLLKRASILEGTESEKFGNNEWMLMLVGRLAYIDGRLDVLYSSLDQGGGDVEGNGKSVSRSQLCLLQVLANPDMLDWVPLGEPSWEGAYKAFKMLVGIAKELMAILVTADKLEGIRPENAGEALRAVFSVLKSLSCLEKDAVLDSGEDVVTAICNEGLVDWLLHCLRSLEPVQNPRRQAPSYSSNEGQSSESSVMNGSGCPICSPYVGYRSDAVAMLSNVVYLRKHVQNMVVEQGGVQLILNQCQIDEGSPLVREWGIWAIRNLSEDNPEVQDMIKNLEMKGVVKNEELDKLGIRIDVDRVTGKLRVGKKEYGGYSYL